MKNYLLYYLLLLSANVLSQQEACNWYFGENAGLKFQVDGSVIPMIDGQLDTLEGCATLSDTNGNLLFYTDGITIWNKNHSIMLNGIGLMGEHSTTQSATIVQKPGSPHLFYVFTLDARAQPNGFRYSEIDINLDGGLGGVTANKNVLIYTPSCEKLSVVKHVNGTDFWIITHGYNNNNFYSYLLTASGLNSIPVTSSVGITVDNSDILNVQGTMKISPDGTKLIVCHEFLDVAELFDYDCSTGIVSGGQIIFTSDNLIYGAEFSPNSKVLYISIETFKKIYQFDLTAANIPASILMIAQLTAIPGALQLAPNNKIYIATYGTTALSVINNPNIVGMGCNLQENAVSLAGKESRIGLPAFNQSFFDATFTVENLCFGSNTEFNLVTTDGVISALWNFGDGNTSTQLNPIHNYGNAGIYNVSLTITTTTGVAMKNKTITIASMPTFATPPANLSICGAASMDFDLSQFDSGVLGSQSPIDYGIAYYDSLADATAGLNNLPINYPLSFGSNTFYVKIYNRLNQTCAVITSFTISLQQQPIAYAPSAFTICEDMPYDNTELFNLLVKNSEVLNGQSASDFTVSYHLSQFDADNDINLLPNNYTNTSSIQTIFVRLENNLNTVCFATTNFQLKVIQQPSLFVVSDFNVCDDQLNDGFASFDLGVKTMDVLNGQSPIDFEVKYYYSFTDADNGTNEIIIPISNTSAIQTVYYTISAVGNDNCKVVSDFNLVVNNLPIVNSINTIRICDDLSNDDIGIFDLQSLIPTILGAQNSTEFSVKYYASQGDADLAVNDLPLSFNNSVNPQSIYARIENNSNPNCFATTLFQLIVSKMPIAAKPQDMISCDDDSNDGIEVFDLSLQNSTILGSQSASGFNISYHASLNDADLGLNAINTNYSNTGNPQTIYARLTNSANQECYDTTTFQLIVREKPEVNLSDSYSICEGNSITISAPSGFTSYLWSNGSVSESLNVTESGIYSLTVTEDYNDIICDATKTFTVYKSNIAVIKSIDVTDWTVNENQINIQAFGDGNYDYSIDGIHFQDSSQFYGLPSGEYKVYVRDKTGCGTATEDVFLLMYPKFFTPNEDGINDFWRVKFSEYESGMNLKIFDRYGKFIKEFTGADEGWDGKLNGDLLPSSDYWFMINRADKRQYKGHFTLKR